MLKRTRCGKREADAQMRGDTVIAMGHLHSTSTSHLQPCGGESFSTDRFRELPSCNCMVRTRWPKRKRPVSIEAAAPEETERCYMLAAGRNEAAGGCNGFPPIRTEDTSGAGSPTSASFSPPLPHRNEKHPAPREAGRNLISVSVFVSVTTCRL